MRLANSAIALVAALGVIASAASTTAQGLDYPPDELARFIAAEIARWGKVVEKSGASVE